MERLELLERVASYYCLLPYAYGLFPLTPKI